MRERVDGILRRFSNEIVFGRAGRLIKSGLPLVRAFKHVLEGLTNITVLLVVGVEVVLELIDQAGEGIELIVNLNPGVLSFGADYCAVNGGGTVLNKLDKELDTLI